jgi:hypothetical protein
MTSQYTRPSAADRWVNCPGSVALYKLHQPEDTSSIYANEGSAAHALAEMCLLMGMDPHELVGDVVYKDEGEGIWRCDEDMADAVAFYIDYVREIAGEDGAVESKVPLFYDSSREGTIDFVHSKGNHVDVIDYKHGQGVMVSAAENLQLLCYAISWVEYCVGVKSVTLHIVQPRGRGDKISTATYTVADLEHWKTFILAAYETAHAAEVDDPEAFCPSESACRWCAFKGSCEARANSQLDKLGFVPLDELQEELAVPGLIDAKHFHTLLDAASEIRGWLDDLEAEALSRARGGEAIPGWKLVRSSPNRRWSDELKAASYIHDAGIDAYVKKIISPAQAEKALKKAKATGEQFVSLAHYITRPQGSVILVQQEDKRAEVQLATFENLDNETEED